MKRFCIITKRDGVVLNPRAYEKLFAEFKDGKIKLEASRMNQRSLPQNAYLHGLLIPEFRKALNSVGYDEVKTDAQSKEILKSMFLKQQVVNKETGEIIEYTKRTRDLSKEEMCILVDEVIKFAAENMHYQIPFPSEQLIMNYD